MVRPTQKRVYFTRHAEAEHKYVLALGPWDLPLSNYASLVSCIITTVRAPARTGSIPDILSHTPRSS